jgi:hypothetical protein
MTGMNKAVGFAGKIQENFEEMGARAGSHSAWANSDIFRAVVQGTDHAMLHIYTTGRTPSSKQET